MSIKIGITGGIGSGKSVVSRLFGIMGNSCLYFRYRSKAYHADRSGDLSGTLCAGRSGCVSKWCVESFFAGILYVRSSESCAESE